MECLAMNGHSFGGMTSAMASIEDERIKICLILDPYLGAMIKYKNFEEYNFGD